MKSASILVLTATAVATTFLSIPANVEASTMAGLTFPKPRGFGATHKAQLPGELKNLDERSLQRMPINVLKAKIGNITTGSDKILDNGCRGTVFGDGEVQTFVGNATVFISWEVETPQNDGIIEVQIVGNTRPNVYDSTVATLIPGQSFTASTQVGSIKIPDYHEKCATPGDCVFRWTLTVGEQDKYVSCADIKIVAK